MTSDTAIYTVRCAHTNTHKAPLSLDNAVIMGSIVSHLVVWGRVGVTFTQTDSRSEVKEQEKCIKERDCHSQVQRVKEGNKILGGDIKGKLKMELQSDWLSLWFCSAWRETASFSGSFQASAEKCHISHYLHTLMCFQTCDFISSVEHEKRYLRYFEECLSVLCPYNGSQWVQTLFGFQCSWKYIYFCI